MQTPLYDMLLAYKERNTLRMHMPGHKGKALGSFNCISEIDVTELSATDDLYEAKGAIKEAQELVANAYGAGYTQFLTNGATAGIIAAITACASEGQRIIADRGSHRSLISASIIAGCHVTYSGAHMLRGGGMAPVETKEIEKLLEKTNAKVVYITSPNYYGQVANVAAIAKIAHERDAVLIVDQAHGAHFAFSELLPADSCKLGADIVICSAHKTLSALTQGAFLHINNDSLKDAVLFRLRAVQTSSPSFPIMASLDVARAQAEEASEKYSELINHINKIKRQLLENGIETLKVDDPLKLIVDMSEYGGGFFAKEKLEEKCIFAEMADLVYVCFIVTLNDTIEELDKLKTTLLSLERIGKRAEEVTEELPSVPFIMSIRRAVNEKQVRLSLYKAIGRICARDIGVYPPGVPVVAPGQMITKEAVEYIDNIVRAGGATFNISGGVYVIE